MYKFCVWSLQRSVSMIFEIPLRQIDAFHGFGGYLITNDFEKNVPIGIEFEYDVGVCNFLEKLFWGQVGGRWGARGGR